MARLVGISRLAAITPIALATACGGGGDPAPGAPDVDAAGADAVDAGEPIEGDAEPTTPACLSFASPVELGQVAAGAGEISGLVASPVNPGVLWVNDDEVVGQPVLYALAADGSQLAALALDDAARDPEDLARGPGPDADLSYLYLADTGNNWLSEVPMRLLRVPEPELAAAAPDAPPAELSADADVIELVYDDGALHDAEAILVDDASGDLYLFTKRSADDVTTRLYRGADVAHAADGDTITLETVLTEEEQPYLGVRVVSADRSTDGDWLLIGGKEAPYLLWPRMGRPIEEALVGVPCHGPTADGQIETGAFAVDGSGYYMIPEGAAAPVLFVARDG